MNEKKNKSVEALPCKSREPAVLQKYRSYLLLERGLSANTQEAYLRDVGRLVDFLKDEGLELRCVKLADVHRFTWAVAELGVGERSMARIISGVRSFFRFLLLDGYIDSDPTELLRTPSFGKHLPEVLTLEEVDAILGAIDLSHRDGHRDHAIIEMLYSCGLRVSELCNLKLSNLFLDDRYIRIKGKGSKERLVPISPRAIRDLELWFVDRNGIEPHAGEEDFVFISAARRRRLSRITVFHNIRIFAERAGIMKAINPHTFRHTFATHLLEGGANLRAIQLLLGHESIGTTEIYTHLNTHFLRDQILRFFPRNCKEGS